MKTLTRPMFNMGGPIKQGVMHGIREPHFLGRIVGGGLSQASRLANRFNLSGGPGGWWSKIKPTGKFRKVPVPKGYPTGKSRQIGARLNVSGKGFEGPAPYSKTEMIKNPRILWEGIKENPYWSGIGGTLAVTSGAAPVAGGGIGKAIKAAALQAADLAVYDEWFDQDKYFADKKKAAEELQKNLEMGRIKAINEAQRVLDIIRIYENAAKEWVIYRAYNGKEEGEFPILYEIQSKMAEKELFLAIKYQKISKERIKYLNSRTNGGN